MCRWSTCRILNICLSRSDYVHPAKIFFIKAPLELPRGVFFCETVPASIFRNNYTGYDCFVLFPSAKSYTNLLFLKGPVLLAHEQTTNALNLKPDVRISGGRGDTKHKKMQFQNASGT